MRAIILLFLIFILKQNIFKCEKPDWAKKDIRDYNDADMERLYEQWEKDEDELEPDELPEHLRPQPKIDFNNIDASNPESLLKLTKKGKTLMMFVNVDSSFNKKQVEEITGIWQTSLMNNHLIAERYVIGEHRVIYMFKDGSQAWEAKDFLVNQKEVDEVTIENKSYYGKNSPKFNKEEL